jgi:hypothetical protein
VREISDLKLPADIYVREAARNYVSSAIDSLEGVHADLKRTQCSPAMTPVVADVIDQLTSALSVIARISDHHLEEQ